MPTKARESRGAGRRRGIGNLWSERRRQPSRGDDPFDGDQQEGSVLVYGQVIATDTPPRIRANAAVQEAYLGSAVAEDGHA